MSELYDGIKRLGMALFYRHEVESNDLPTQIDVDEIIEWMNENFTKQWWGLEYIIRPVFSLNKPHVVRKKFIRLRFLKESDAMAFKLRWS